MSTIAIVERRSGAPRIAPIATSSLPAPPPMIATTGMSDSGSAVATAANRLPTAPWPGSSLLPNHSMPFVKRSAPARRIAKLAGRRTAELTTESFPATGASTPSPQRRGTSFVPV